MSLFLSVVLLSLVLEDDDFLALSFFNYLAFYSCSYVRSTNLDTLAFTKYENVIEANCFTNCCIKLFYGDNVAFLYSVLLSACFNNCVHV